MIDQLQILLHLLLAAVLGALVGLEREWKDKPAGLRTNIIIATASCLFVFLGHIIVRDFKPIATDEAMGVDPIRVLHAIIVGVSVIGAGTIFKREGKDVKYLTTAATTLMSCGLGITVALKQYWLAVGATLIILLINTALRRIRSMISHRSR